MTDERLLIPLADLPGPVPMGAPAWFDGAPMTVLWARGDRVFLVHADGYTGHAQKPEDVSLDISPPPLIDGWPSRIDGADVATRALARAMGMEPGPVTWLSSDGKQWRLETHSTIITTGTRYILFGARFSGAWTNGDHDVVVPRPPKIPALTDIDPTDPLADRLALAAVLRAKPWEER